MLRLAHRILSQNAFVLDAAAKCNQQRAQALMEATRKDLREGIPIIIADNVGEYVMHCEDKASIAFGNLPPAPPPFPNCFVEWLAPSHQRIATGQIRLRAAESGVLQFGCSLVNVGDGNSTSQTLDEIENLTQEERYSTATCFLRIALRKPPGEWPNPGSRRVLLVHQH